MAYSYNKLWKLMIDKKINKTRLRQEAGITSNAMTNMGKDMSFSSTAIISIISASTPGGMQDDYVLFPQSF